MRFNEELRYWTKKNGEKILVADMSNDYLMQTIRNLESNAKNGEGKIDPSKLDKMHGILKLHAIGRNLIKVKV